MALRWDVPPYTCSPYNRDYNRGVLFPITDGWYKGEHPKLCGFAGTLNPRP